MTKINPNAIDLAAGFEVGSVQPIDSRLNMTVAQMASVSDDVMPDTYLTVCKDDGAIYLYNKTNTVDPTTGKFRKLEGVEADFLEKVTVMPEVVEDAVVCYVGEDTENYKQGHIYKGVVINSTSGAIPVAQFGYTYVIFNHSESQTSSTTLAIFTDIDSPERAQITLGAGDTVFVSEDGLNFYADVLVESESDNKLYPSTKMDDPDYVYDLSDRTSWPTMNTYQHFQSGSSILLWKEAIDLSEINDKLSKIIEKVTTIPQATEADVTSNRVLLYMGTTTQDYIHGHFYQAVSDGQDPATYSWEEFDTEADDYDHIENRPLILTRGEELYNDTVTLDAGDTTTTTIADKVLVADKEYIISVDGVEHSYTAVLDTTDNSINLDASDIGIVITTADGDTDSEMVLTNADFSADPAIIVKESNTVEVNPDYADFFESVTDGASMQEDVTANIEVGGVAVGDTVAQGKTLTEVMKQLLVKYFAPTVSITTTKSLIQKKGTTLTQPIDIKVVSTKKSDNITKTWIEDAEGNELDAGTTPAGETLNYEWETDITTDTTFYGKATDGKTPVSSSIKFEFIDPFYWGETTTNELDQAAIEALTMDLSKRGTSKKYTYPTPSVASYFVIAYPKSYDVLTKIQDQNLFDNTPDWNRSEVVFNEGESDEVTYYVYVTSDKKTFNKPFFYTFMF